jgi:aspartate-semialdehyde dehydrogenase
LQSGRIAPADITVSAQCNRVPVKDGHTSCVSLKLTEPASPEAVREALRTFTSPLAGKGLPSAPATFIQVDDAPDHPQPDRHVQRGRGMTVSVGRIRPCEVLDIKFVTLVHNTVRGAAGGAVLNAELLMQEGYLSARQARATARA